MDPAALAAAATALLVPFLSKVGQGIADQAEKKLPEHVEQIWEAVLAKFKGKPAAEASAGDLKAKAAVGSSGFNRPLSRWRRVHSR